MQLCKACFFAALEEEVHQTITQHALFSPGERVAVAASGAAQDGYCQGGRPLPVLLQACFAAMSRPGQALHSRPRLLLSQLVHVG